MDLIGSVGLVSMAAVALSIVGVMLRAIAQDRRSRATRRT